MRPQVWHLYRRVLALGLVLWASLGAARANPLPWFEAYSADFLLQDEPFGVVVMEWLDHPKNPRYIYWAEGELEGEWTKQARWPDPMFSEGSPAWLKGETPEVFFHAQTAADQPYHLYHRAYHGNGDWGPSEKVSFPYDVQGINPSVVRKGETVFLLFQETDPRGTFISFSRSEDGGKSFAPPERIAQQRFLPRLGMTAEGHLVAAYQGRSFRGAFEIFVSESRDGRLFSEPTQVSQEGNSHDPWFHLNSNGDLSLLYIASFGPRDPYEIMLRRALPRTRNQSLTFTESQRLTRNVQMDVQPRGIALSEGYSLFLWGQMVPDGRWFIRSSIVDLNAEPPPSGGQEG